MGEALTIEQMGQTLTKVLGVGPVQYNAVEADVYRSFGFPGADEMGNMFQAYRDFDKADAGEPQRRHRAQAESCFAELRAVRHEAEGRDQDGDGRLSAARR